MNHYDSIFNEKSIIMYTLTFDIIGYRIIQVSMDKYSVLSVRLYFKEIFSNVFVNDIRLRQKSFKILSSFLLYSELEILYLKN